MRYKNQETHTRQWGIRRIPKGNHKTWNGIPKGTIKHTPSEHNRKSHQNIQKPFQINTGSSEQDLPNEPGDRLLPQRESTLSILWTTNIAPTISAYTYMYGQYNYNKLPLSLMGVLQWYTRDQTQEKHWTTMQTMATISKHWESIIGATIYGLNKHGAYKWQTQWTSSTNK